MKKYIFTLTILILLSSSLLAADESDRIDCVCSAGFSNTAKVNYWHHLNVTMTSFYPEKVEVLVKVSRKHQYEPELILQQVITIAPPKTAEKLKYKLTFVCPPFKDSADSEYIIEVLDNSDNSTLLKESYWTTITRNEKEYPVKRWRSKSFISLRPNTLENYEEQILTCNSGLRLPFFNKNYIKSEDNKESNISFSNIQVEDIPSNWLALESIKLIVLCNPDINKLKLFNREKSLENWVRSGGIILLMLSEKYLEYKNMRLVKLAGLNLKGSKTVYEITEKANSYFDSTTILPGKLNGINAELTTDSKNTYEIFVDAKQKNPVVTSTWVDAGILNIFLFDFRGKKSAEFNKIFQQYMAERFILPLKNYIANKDYDNSENDYGYGYGYNNYGYNTNNVNVHKNLGTIINNIQKAKPVSFEIIAIFICCYMFVIAFFDYILLKFLSALHWTWLSVLIWVVAFVIAADYIGESFRGGEMNLREVAVLDSGGLYESAKISQYAGVFSQQNLSYTVYHDNAESGITRLDRIYFQEEDYNRYYYDEPEDNSYMRRALELDKNSTYSVYQLADVTERKYKGTYLKSVVLPRWAIRDIQAKSLHKYANQGIPENSSEADTSGVDKNTQNRRGLQITVAENNDMRNLYLINNSGAKTRYVPDKILTVTNKYPFSIRGFVIIYSNKKTFLCTEKLAPGEKKDIFYFEDFILLVDPEITSIDGFESSDLSLQSILDDYDSNSNFGWLDTQDSLELVLGNRYFTASPEFCSLFFTSFANNFMNEVNSTQDKSQLSFKNYSYSGLDVSHRLIMGDTIIFGWTDSLTQQDSGYYDDDPLDEENYDDYSSAPPAPPDMPIQPPSSVRYPDANEETFEKSIIDLDFPSIKFENWEPIIERFILIREFQPPLQLLLRIK